MITEITRYIHAYAHHISHKLKFIILYVNPYGHYVTYCMVENMLFLLRI